MGSWAELNEAARASNDGMDMVYKVVGSANWATIEVGQRGVNSSPFANHQTAEAGDMNPDSGGSE